MGGRPAKRWHRRIFWSLLALLGVITLCVTWLFTADLGVFKPQIEKLVAERLGREFSIDGDLDIRLGRNLEVSAEHVVLANADWVDGPVMMNLGRFSARVNLWSIYSGPTIVEMVNVENTTLNLTKSATNETNWTFAVPESADAPSAPKEPLSLLLQALEIDDVRIVFENAHRPETVNINIRAWRQQLGDDDMLKGSIDATINNRDVELHGTVGTWASLLDRRNVGFDVNGQLGTITVQAKGLIDDLRTPSRPEVDFQVAGPSIAHFSSLLGLGEVDQGDIDLAGSLSIEDGGQLSLNLKGNLGRLQVDAVGRAAAIDNLEIIDLNVAANGPSLGRVFSYFGVDRVSEEPFDLSIDLYRDGPIVSVKNTQLTFGDSILKVAGELPNFPALNDSIVSFEMSGPRIEQFRRVFGLRGVWSGPYFAKLDVNARKSGKPVLQATVRTTLGEITGRGRLSDPPHFLGSNVEFELEVPSLRQLGRIAGMERLPNQPIAASGSISRGDDRWVLEKPLHIRTESIAASISGYVKLKSRLLGTAVQFEVDGQDLRDTLSRVEVDAGIPALPYTASGAAHFVSGGIELRNVDVDLGSSTIELDGLLAFLKGLSGTNVKIGATGQSMEELFSGLDNVDVHPGPFETTASVRLSNTEIRIEDFKLERALGKLALDARIGWPLTTKRLDVDLDARGPDIRSLVSELGGLEPASLPFRIKARVERDGSEWSFRPLQISLGEANAEARGRLALQQHSVTGRLGIEAEIPDLSSVGKYRGRRPKPLPAHLSATLDGDGNHISVDDLSATFDESVVSGQLTYRFAPVPDLELTMRSESLVVLPIFEADTSKANQPPAAEDGRVIPATGFPSDLLRVINGTFDIEVGELQRNGLQATNVQFRSTLDDGTLSIDTLNLDTRGGHVAISGRLVDHDTGGHARLKLTADNLDMASPTDDPVTIDFDFDILASGANLRELAANSNGFFVLEADEGDFARHAAVNFFYSGFIQQLLGALNPLAKSKDITRLDCAVVGIDILDGVVMGNPAFYAQTDSIRLFANAVINLETEGLDVAFETLPRRSFSLLSIGEVVNPYIGVVGTFSDPHLKLDQTSAVVAGGAAVATAGLSIVAKGFWDRLKNSDDVCARAREAAEVFRERYAFEDNP